MEEKSTGSEMSGNIHSLCEKQAMMAGVNMEKENGLGVNYSTYDKEEQPSGHSVAITLSKHGEAVDGPAERSVVHPYVWMGN